MHDRTSGEPIPDHISARWQDIDTLIAGLLETAKKLGINVFNYIHDRINQTLDRTLADEMKIRSGPAMICNTT